MYCSPPELFIWDHGDSYGLTNHMRDHGMEDRSALFGRILQ